MKPKNIIFLIIIVLVLIILIQNTHVITFQLLFWEISMSLIIFMLLIVLIGFALGYFVHAKTKKK